MPPSEPQPVRTRAAAAEDPRVYLAAERTFLAWIRTGLALMGFGFVVARFGLFLREIEFSQHPLSLHSAKFTLWVNRSRKNCWRSIGKLVSGGGAFIAYLPKPAFQYF